LVKSDFNINGLSSKIKDLINGVFNREDSNLANEFNYRVENLADKIKSFDSLSRKYYYLRFEVNLRKYFGAEVNSYNDYLYCFSPFIENEFMDAFAKTSYMGDSHPFNSNDLKLKMRTTLLYYKLIKRNYESLTKYNTARGYSMKDAASISGKLKILIQKKLQRGKNKVDAFNTQPTDELFVKIVDESDFIKYPVPINLARDWNIKNVADINSLYLWSQSITGKYLL